MNEDVKHTMIQRIYRLIARRDTMRRQFLDNDGNFNRDTRQWMPEYARYCHFMKNTVKVSKVTGSIDPTALAVATGRREAFEWLMERLNFTDENAIKMIEQLNQQED